LIGAGPWAQRAHAPALAAGPHTRLAGIWARRPDAARNLATRFDTIAYDTLPELLEACDALAFAVPPAIQSELGVMAAKSGLALLLEKPLAADLDGARRLAEAIAEAGVPSQMALTLRYASTVRAFLARARAIKPFGGHAEWVSGGVVGGPFATPWRRQRGAILDVGPHVIDLLDAALGRVAEVRAHGSASGWAGLLLAHAGGAVSEVSLCTRALVERPVCRVEIYGDRGSAVADPITVDGDTWTTIAREFAATVRQGGGHPLDAWHGLRLQEIIQAAEWGLGREGAIRPAGRQ